MEISPRTLLVLVLSCRALFCQGVEVLTPKGKIIGSESLKSRNGRTIYSFIGIPYAKPPVGELRFKEAQPVEPWSETLNATKKIPTCLRTANDKLEKSGPPVKGQEDCLILNVYSPKVGTSPQLSVMVWVHGGAFRIGSSEAFGPEFLLDKDVVLVTINYRLGPLGFASTGDDAIPANLGLKDQALALRWIHDNIEGFGGNPAKVTVFGDSAGGVSAHLFALSPTTKGLIHGGIAQSGTSFVPWGLLDPQLVKDRTKALAVLVGCPSEPSKELLSCMQTTPADLILEMTDKFTDWKVSPLVVFGPTVETGNVKNPFLPVHPKQLESHIPLMIGVSSGEGGLVASILFKYGKQYLDMLRKSPEQLLSSILMLRSKFSRDKVPIISRQIKEFYFGNRTIDKNTTQELIDMSTDSWFLEGAMEAALNYKGNAYFYYYDYRHTVSFNSIFGDGEIKGASHSDIFLNLFPLTNLFPNRTLSETDVQVSEQVVDIWTNFAQFGKPSESLSEWKPIRETANQTVKYLHITAGEPSIKENLLPRRVEFWKALNRLQTETVQ